MNGPKLSAERVMNGTHGEAWLDGEYVSEVIGLQAKVEFIKEDVPVVGGLADDSKFMGYKCTGSLRMHKVNSRMKKKIGALIKQGINPRLQILSSLADPAAYGAERVLIKDANFNDLTLADWEAKVKGQVEAPFTFTDWEDKDLV